MLNVMKLFVLLIAISKAFLTLPVTYKLHDVIPVRVSTVAPFHNPTEQYDYDILPWPCKPLHSHSDNFNLNSLFNGERTRNSLYKIEYLSTELQTVCGEKELHTAAINQFIDAIDNDYQYEMRIDDLPVFGSIGFKQQSPHIVDGKLYFLIKHRHFNIKYNGDQIISVNISRSLSTEHYIELQKGESLDKIDFTYSVSWIPTRVPYSERFTSSTQKVEIHWYWILNTSCLVILLSGLLSTILIRTIKNDMTHYLMVSDENDIDADSGWKRIRFDVFRAPPQPYLFGSIVGVGCQLLMISFFLLILAVIGYFYKGNHGTFYVAALFLYSFTSYISGYVSSAKTKEFLGYEYDWFKSCAFTLFLFSGPYLMVFSVVNSIGWYYKSVVALPFGTILTVILLWAFVTFPLTLFGSFRAKAQSNVWSYPSSINSFARCIPYQQLPWYHNELLLLLMVGVLQFMSIYVELHTIFNSVWGHQPYTLFGILLLTFCILLVVTSCLVILTTYFQLNAENYKWWWPSLIRGASCGLFIFFYSIYYWFYTSQMTPNSLQIVIYFGYTFLISYGSSLILSSVAHWASRWFVNKIYSSGWYD